MLLSILGWESHVLEKNVKRLIYAHLEEVTKKQKRQNFSKIYWSIQKQKAFWWEHIVTVSHLNDGTVSSPGFNLGRDDVRRPVRQPIVDGDHEGVFEELWQEEQGEQEEPGGGQVGATGAPRDGGTLAHYMGQVVVFVTLYRFLWDQDRQELQR